MEETKTSGNGVLFVDGHLFSLRADRHLPEPLGQLPQPQKDPTCWRRDPPATHPHQTSASNIVRFGRKKRAKFQHFSTIFWVPKKKKRGVRLSGNQRRNDRPLSWHKTVKISLSPPPSAALRFDINGGKWIASRRAENCAEWKRRGAWERMLRCLFWLMYLFSEMFLRLLPCFSNLWAMNQPS